MAPNNFSDDLFESMTPSSGQTPASEQLRNAVLSRTTQTVRNRRRLRRAGLALALAACYLGGVATMSLRPSDRLVARASSAQNGDEVRGSEVRRAVRPEDDQIADGSISPSAARLTPYERLCREGDLQLERHDDIRAAARSYNRALQLASAEQRDIAPDHDTWLLMAMKQSTN